MFSLGINLIILFSLEFFLLLLLSRYLTRSLGTLIFSITKNKTFTVNFLALMFLPGTIIHELSHFLIAAILFVPVGEIEFMPKVEKDQIRLGTCEIGKTDILRRTIIGLAPIAVGLSIILGSLWFFKLGLVFWQLILLAYIIFEIGNTMFSSKKDLEGALAFFTTIFVLFLIFFIILYINKYIVDFSFLIRFLNSENVIYFFQKADILILVPLIIDTLIFAFLKIIRKRANLNHDY